MSTSLIFEIFNRDIWDKVDTYIKHTPLGHLSFGKATEFVVLSRQSRWYTEPRSLSMLKRWRVNKEFSRWDRQQSRVGRDSWPASTHSAWAVVLAYSLTQSPACRADTQASPLPHSARDIQDIWEFKRRKDFQKICESRSFKRGKLAGALKTSDKWYLCLYAGIAFSELWCCLKWSLKARP